MAFLRIKPYEPIVTKSHLLGAKDQVVYAPADDKIPVNVDFIVTIAKPDKPGLPEDMVLLVMHDGSTIPVVGPLSDVDAALRFTERKTK